ncbi:hypothetical protein [Streptomyces sp. 4N124]|uniref:hypothetical protein n=1 Tax=Streptomyces sp. 4N124 TaxID=3457420 RepID=UPI003FD1378B
MGGHGTGAEEPVRHIGPYRIVALLGEGGMGAVHLGRDRRGRPAAVKVLRAELSRDAEMVRRFRREADAASAVRYRPRARRRDPAAAHGQHRRRNRPGPRHP